MVFGDHYSFVPVGIMSPELLVHIFQVHGGQQESRIRSFPIAVNFSRQDGAAFESDFNASLFAEQVVHQRKPPYHLVHNVQVQFFRGLPRRIDFIPLSNMLSTSVSLTRQPFVFRFVLSYVVQL